MLIKNGLVFTKDGLQKLDIEIKDGKIEKVAPAIEGTADIDAAGRIVSPGFVDLHCHLREPGAEYKETIATGTAAAAKGGFTTVCAMPNLSPTPDTKEEIENAHRRITETAAVKVLPYGTITKGEKGQALSDIAAMAPLVAGFSDDGKGVQSEEMMRAGMAEVAKTGKYLAAHCEVESFLNGGYIHDGAYARRHGHKGILSISETQEVERDIRLASETGARLHICHVSAKESVEAIRAGKAQGVKLTAEVTPHQLLVCDEDITEDHGRFKMNPPLREKADQAALRAALADGTIDIIGTDHAPHSDEEKGKGLAGSAMGVVGFETAFAALHTGLVKTGVLPLETLLQRMTFAPAAILGVPCGVEEGNPADLVILDTETPWTVEGQRFLSKGKATPFEGWQVTGKPVCTLVNGKVAYREASL